MLPPLVAGELDDAAVRGERAAEDRQAAGRLERPFDRDDDLLARRLDGGRGDLGDRPAVDRHLVAVEQALLEQLAHDERDAAGVVHLRRREPAARLHVGDDRRPVRDDPELVDVEGDPELVGDRQEMQHAVGRAAGRGDRRDAVLERRLR